MIGRRGFITGVPEISGGLPHVFEMDWSVWTALGAEEIASTVDGMREMGIYELPFTAGEIVLRLRLDAIKNAEVYHEVRGLRDGEEFDETVIVYPKVPVQAIDWYRKNPAMCSLPDRGDLIDRGITIEKKRIVHRFGFLFEPESSRTFFRDGLIVLLASKGLSKQSKKSGLAKLGIGKRCDEYVTTIRIGEGLERHESARPGMPVRPHLRRGHIRNQHHGPKNSLVKRIWVEPCFVNADADFVSTRKAYRVVH